MVVDHHNGRYVSLPFRSTDESIRTDSMNATEMLGDNVIRGRGLNRSALTRVNLGDWSKDLTISSKTEESTSRLSADKTGEGDSGT